MKNLKNTLATLVLVTIMGVSTSFATGLYVNDSRSCNSKVSYSTGILIADSTGILIADTVGILIADAAGLLISDRANVPCVAATEGILIAD